MSGLLRRREFCGGVAAGLAGTAVPGNFWGMGAKRPNIVLIMADDMGYSDIGCYGSEIQTPALDSLANNGIRFTQFYNAARCCPTRGSLLTGLYPQQTGVGAMVNNHGLPAYSGDLNQQCLTIAEVLKTADYQTYMSGKWHVTPPTHDTKNWPRQRGFDRFYGTIRGAGSFFNPFNLTLDNEHIAATDPDYYYTDAIGDYACQFIDESQRSDDPFFLYMPFTAPHWPLHAKPEDIKKYDGVYDKGWDQLRQDRWERMKELGVADESWGLADRDPQVPAWEDVEHKDWEAYRMQVYAAQIDSMDQAIGRVVDKLKQIGQFENTLIFFLADNGGCHEEIGEGWRNNPSIPDYTRDGEPVRRGNSPDIMPGPEDTYASYGRGWANASNTPFRMFKHWTHEGGNSTPLIVHWPEGVRRPGSITDEVGHIIDIMSTCVDVAGARFPKTYQNRDITPMEGKSLYPIMRSGSRSGHELLVWEHMGNAAVRKGDWKLVKNRNQGEWELYNLADDRSESNNLIDEKSDKANELKQDYEHWCERVGVVEHDIYRQSRLQFHLRMNDPNSTNLIYDDSGNERHFACQGTRMAYDPEYSARAFDGESNFLELQTQWTPNLNGGAMIFACAFEYTGNDGVLLAHRNDEEGFAFEIDQGVMTLSVRNKSEEGGVRTIGLGGIKPKEGWNHIVFALRKNGQGICNRNGEEQKPINGFKIDGERLTSEQLYSTPNNQPMRIAADFNGEKMFKGRIADVKLITGEWPDELLLREFADVEE